MYISKHPLVIQKVFLVGAIAKLGATVSTYPLQVVKVNSYIFPSLSCKLVIIIKKRIKSYPEIVHSRIYECRSHPQ